MKMVVTAKSLDNTLVGVDAFDGIYDLVYIPGYSTEAYLDLNYELAKSLVKESDLAVSKVEHFISYKTGEVTNTYRSNLFIKRTSSWSADELTRAILRLYDVEYHYPNCSVPLLKAIKTALISEISTSIVLARGGCVSLLEHYISHYIEVEYQLHEKRGNSEQLRARHLLGTITENNGEYFKFITLRTHLNILTAKLRTSEILDIFYSAGETQESLRNKFNAFKTDRHYKMIIPVHMRNFIEEVFCHE